MKNAVAGHGAFEHSLRGQLNDHHIAVTPPILASLGGFTLITRTSITATSAKNPRSIGICQSKAYG